MLVLFLNSSNILQRNRIKVILENNHLAKNYDAVLSKHNCLSMLCRFWFRYRKSKASYL